AIDLAGSTSGTYTVTYSFTNGTCLNTTTASVTINGIPTTSAAGPDQLTACGTVALAGNAPTVGTGNWGFAPGGNPDGLGAILNATSNASGFNGTVGQTYSLRWTISNGACASSTDDVTITFKNPGVTSSNAGADQNKCNDGNFTLAANAPAGTETGTWILISGTAAITTVASNTSTVTALTGSAVLRWIISDGLTCSSFDDITLTNSPIPTTSAAGGDQSVCGTTATLAANTPVSGAGAWSIVSGAGGVITTLNNPTTTFVGTAGTTYVLRWTITSGNCPVSTDDVSIRLDQVPTVATAGLDQNNVCGTISLNANTPVVGTGAWTIVSGAGGAIVDATNPQSDFGGTIGSTYMLRWSITNGVCAPSTDDVQITFSNANLTVSNSNHCQNLGNLDLTSRVSATPAGGVLTFTGTNVTGSTLDPTSLSDVQTISVQYVSGGCTVNKLLFINVLLPTNPACASSGGTGNCATVVITPISSPATCTLSNGSINFNINPATPNVNTSGVKITITGISTTNSTVARTNFNDPAFPALPIGVYNYSIEYGDVSCLKTGQVTVDQSGGGPDLVNFSLEPLNIQCFGNKGGVAISKITGSNSVNYDYQIIDENGNQITVATKPASPISQLQATGTVNILELDKGNYKISLSQSQPGCTISTAFKSFTVLEPIAALDTLYVTRKISLPDQPTGTMLVGLKESQQIPYQVRLELKRPIDPLQAFLLDYTDFPTRNAQNLKIEYNIRNLFAGFYELKVRDARGCEKTYADIEIKVDGNVFIPNVFTPNEDGSNETFFIRNLPEDSKVNISNRWGAEVYSSNNYQNDWDGGNNADGIYFYRIVVGENTFTGWVEIIRGK
ncbi:MAG: gliding motility-associated C-terminal domain-containing protein, partial [Cyclobacteriaceae bacterium]|nr:gliding motility-associated C-terminal domain-containing protein [Cyclobacteriaceae bacterium]